MSNAKKRDEAVRISKWATILTLLGFIVVIFSLVYGTIKLNLLEPQIQEKEDKLNVLDSANAKLEKELLNKEQQLLETRKAAEFVATGIHLYRDKKYELAVREYNKALKLDSLNAYVINIKGYSLFKAKRYNEAVEVLHKSVEVQPDYAWGYFDLARVYCATGNYDAALKAINKALELRPDLIGTIKRDGEFTGLCRRIMDQIK